MATREVPWVEWFAGTTGLLSDPAILIELASRRVVHVNPAFVERLGFAAALVVGRTPGEAGWLAADSGLDLLLEALAAGPAAHEATLRLRRHDGVRLELAVRAAAIGDPCRRHAQLVACSRASEAASRAEREAIFHGVPVGIALTRDRRFVHVNPAFERIFGWAPGELVGQPGRVVWPSDAAYEEIGRALGPRLARGEPAEHELLHMVWPDGGRRALRLIAQALEPARGTAGGTLWICEDISERIQLAEGINEARARAESASHAKSQFLANMSHELRTPLNALLGLARLLQQDLGDERRRREYVDLIAESARSLSAIVSDILDLSKIEAGHMVLEDGPLDLHALVHSVHASFGVLARARDLAFSVDIEHDVPPVVHGDRLRLRQILANFVNNALKFTSEGSVEIRVARPNDQVIRLSVHDTGPGFDDDMRGRLFQPFSQADDSTTRRHGGTGLGLSISRELATLMGGTVGAESRAGQGSVFWAELPLPASQSTPPNSDFVGLDVDALRGMNVLVVEDNLVNMLICVAQLEQRGASVFQAVDGEQALQLVRDRSAQGRPIDVVLMDLQMPVMGGLEATRRLRVQFDRVAMPIIGLSAAAFTTERAEALDAGMNDFVVKPIEPHKLERAILRVVGSRRA
jgi:PAS domain S-box-containing protein